MSDTLLHHLCARQAALRPDQAALVLPDGPITYGRLEDRARRLASVLRRHGVTRGDRVGLLLPKNGAAFTGMLATLKAGGIYVPLDPQSPPPRLERMITIAGLRAVLACGVTERLLGEVLAGAPALRVVTGWLDDAPPQSLRPSFAWGDVDAAPAEVIDPGPVDPASPAHILFTSGSTGLPKGVMVSHASVLHFVRWAVEYFGTAPGDRISGHPPLHFDLSTFDIYATWLAGAELHPVPAEINLLPGAIADFIRDRALTQWFSVPSVFGFLAKAGSIAPGDFPSLQRVLWCGEVLPTPVLAHWMERLPHATFTNLYGPTEACIASSYYRVPDVPRALDEPVPIGVAIPGEELLVVDEHHRPLPPGETGQLAIAGPGLSPGYWQDEERTRAVFVAHPSGQGRMYLTGDLARRDARGLFHYLGRTDSQIKSRGYRIELGEIETALHALAALKESAVVAVDSEGFEGKVICAAFVPAAPGGATPSTIRQSLRGVIPPYMLPARWLELPALPKNPNGKVDRPALRAMFERQEAGAAR